MFIDEITLSISAGDGGDGIVSWRHEKGIDHAGPGGGDGGKGGDVYIKGVNDIARLAEYRFEKEFKAENGEKGKKNTMHGKSGQDFVLEVPIGSTVTNFKTGDSIDVVSDEKIFLLSGGRGGYGNDHFKGPTNRRPKNFTYGKPGERGVFTVELKLIADAGLVGLPNAGKSSILDALTEASPKIGSYQFTTLTPNLGAFRGYVLADIPGLIEGASQGKGLGHKFLKHISRTKLLIHCIAADTANPVAAYSSIRDELGAYDKAFLSKPEIILITKTDLVEPGDLAGTARAFEKMDKETLSVSVLDDASTTGFADALVKVLKNM